MRFDDTLKTVLAADVSTAFGKASAWRQLVDLIGRRRVPPDPRAVDLLAIIRDAVPIAVRAASMRALAQSAPPVELVRLCAKDDIAVVAPLLRGARLNAGEWIELLPQLTSGGRAVVRERRDLPAGVGDALAMFSGDFAIGNRDETAQAARRTPGSIAEVLGRIRVRPQGEAAATPVAPIEAVQPEPEPEPAPETVPPLAPNTSFVTFGAAAKGIPVVAEALQRASDDGAAGPGAGTGAADRGTFEIADVVARIDAFYTRQSGRPAVRAERPRAEGFRFESDAQGAIRWVDGIARTPLVGVPLDIAALPRTTGVDGAVAGAFRQRSSFSDARLFVTGESEAGGDWRISGNAAFDPATGRFAGYRGVARRPRADEVAGPRVAAGASTADSLRQLMHELRTPTNAIAGFSEMIERQMLGEAPEIYRERAALIRDHARALLAAIDDLDIAARIEASALPLRSGEVALRTLIERVAGELASLVTLRGAIVALPDDDAVAKADARATERLLSRMLATLVSAAGDGETIGVTLSESGERVAIGFTRPRALTGHADQALFDIDDEREDAALLGTGFALRLIRNLANELSGSLTIEAATLTVRLPSAVTNSLEIVR